MDDSAFFHKSQLWSSIPFTDAKSSGRETLLSAIMWQIFFQSILNLFSAGSSVQTLMQGIIVWWMVWMALLYCNSFFKNPKSSKMKSEKINPAGNPTPSIGEWPNLWYHMIRLSCHVSTSVLSYQQKKDLG